jgi:membrane fusion protein (multidrug efflux system)
MQNLLDEQVVSKAEFDAADATSLESEARVNEIRATIERKTIRAPFTGVLGIRQVNKGQYLAGGAPVVSLQSLNPIYVNFGVPQQALAQVHAGGGVRVSTENLANRAFNGRVTAIDAVVDETTRNIQVQATLPNPDGTLHPGMFVQTEMALGANEPVVAIPASAVNYAPYGDSVFIVSDMKNDKGQAYRGVRQQIVKLGSARGDRIAVLSGIKAGDEVVTSGLFKLRNGAAVLVNNKVKPGNSTSPRPENS